MPVTSIPGAISAGTIATRTSPAFRRRSVSCSTTPNSTTWWQTSETTARSRDRRN
jgi:hypothetical protein